jgi:hypothetical protein
LFEAPVATLQDPAVYERVARFRDGRLRCFHSYTVGEHVIWGATGAILHRFLAALEGARNSVQQSA